jgi:hypothetical protein
MSGSPEKIKPNHHILLQDLPNRDPFSAGRPIIDINGNRVIYIERPEAVEIVNKLIPPNSSTETVGGAVLINGWFRTGQTSLAYMAAQSLITSLEKRMETNLQITNFWKENGLGKPNISYINLNFKEMSLGTNIHKVINHDTPTFLEQKAPPIIILDELQSLQDFQGLQYIFTKMSEVKPFIIGIYVGPMEENLHSEIFLSLFGHPVQLKNASDEAIRHFYDQIAPWMPTEVKNWLVQEAGGHPLLAQQLGLCVYDTFRSKMNQDNTILFKDLKLQVVNNLKVSMRLLFKQYLWVLQDDAHGKKMHPFIREAMPRDSAHLFYQAMDESIKNENPKIISYHPL